METRLIEISLDTAKMWYMQGGELKDIALGAFTLEELGVKLPSTFDEYLERCAKWGIKVDAEDYTDRNPQIEALKKLILLRDFYNNGWKPDWSDYLVSKYAIKRTYNREEGICLPIVSYTCDPQSFLVFNSNKNANEFFDNFRDLIEQAEDLI